MRFLVILAVLAFPTVSLATNSYICSYPGFLNSKKPVIIKIKINGESASVDTEQYRVLQNTAIGVVLVRSFAEANEALGGDDVGLFGITIYKKNLSFTRGAVLNGKPDGKIAQGSCVAG